MRPTYPSLPADALPFNGRSCEITGASPQFQEVLGLKHRIDPTIQALHTAATTPQQRFAVTDTPSVESPRGFGCFPFNPITASILR